MPQVLRLQGRSALSAFRLEKLTAAAKAAGLSDITIRADFWHFVQVSSELDEGERERLDRILTYGPRAGSVTPAGSVYLVLPRFGTISPWSSKATDIARHCGLERVMRIERGVSYTFRHAGKRDLAPDEALRINSLIHDRMTETVVSDIADADRLFDQVEPAPLQTVPLGQDGVAALRRANEEMGLALSEDEIEYLAHSFGQMGRDPTDVELMMFAQANSEHCRHKIFNADWIVDGERQSHSLFGMIRHTHATRPQGTVVAYSDNAAIMEGGATARFQPGSDGTYRYADETAHILMKVETHNHPTAISPYPGAATGSGGEIRDEGATGRGAKPKAGLTGFSVSNLCIPGFIQPWEQRQYGKPGRIASALQIMLDGPIGGAAFNNEFGRPNLNGYFRSYEQDVAGERRGYHKPIMIAGGVGNIEAGQCHKAGIPPGALIVQVGGPGMLIGLGGGAASSMDTGANLEDLDFDSVQRGNAEMERRVQEVIDRCAALGERNPIYSIHDVGAGGLSNALPELVHGAGRGAQLQLRSVPTEERGMSPMQIWCNEAQERYVIAIDKDDLPTFDAICQRERCPYAILGTATPEEWLRVDDQLFGQHPVDMDLGVLLGKPPRMVRDVQRVARNPQAFDCSRIPLQEAAYRVLRLPTVADKTFLISIGDRTVGGMTARDQMVGRWQVPVADAAVTLNGFHSHAGEAYAMGERTPVAAIDAPASGRMAIGEALTNIASAGVADIGVLKLSANWMAAAGHPGEDAALYDTVAAVALELCPALGISIPVGKDSLSMKTVWSEGSERKVVTAPVSLIVSAFARIEDVRAHLTPDLKSVPEETRIVLIDLGAGRCRTGGSALAQVYEHDGGVPPDVDDPRHLVAFFNAVQTLNRQGKLLAYHDRSDGGLFSTACEMAFASRCGLTLDISALVGPQRSVQAVLFNEELGALMQVRVSDVAMVQAAFVDAGLGDMCHVVGTPDAGDMFHIAAHDRELFSDSRVNLHRAWSETTFHLQRLRDNPACAAEEHDRLLDLDDPGLGATLTFDPADDVSAPYIGGLAKPRVAILREQGVNGQIEMAAAFDRAGFTAVDLHMSDIAAGRAGLADFAGIAACGGFSYGDVLGAGEGWAKSILFNPRTRDEFAAFFARSDVFSLGVCNGCQMMSNLGELIPGAESWPRFVKNRSEQFEARFVMVEVQESPSLFFTGMAGSRMPIATAHGEGYAEFNDGAVIRHTAGLVALRYVDNRGKVTERYPYNPNGSPDGITGLTTPDGRHTIVMPHPERVFRTVQHSWHPPEWGEDGAWLRMFRNARKWLG